MHTIEHLPYDYDALEPHIDARTTEIHHRKHHPGYVDKLNAALQDHPALLSLSVFDLITTLDEIPAGIRTSVRNNGGGHANHTFFVTSMGPNQPGQPVGELGRGVEDTSQHNTPSEETLDVQCQSRIARHSRIAVRHASCQ